MGFQCQSQWAKSYVKGAELIEAVETSSRWTQEKPHWLFSVWGETVGPLRPLPGHVSQLVLLSVAVT